MATTYSFRNLTGAFAHSLAGAFTFSGDQGVGQIVVHMATEKTTHDTAADGAVQISFVAGDSGTVTIECQQTSEIHAFLLGWFNVIKAAAKGGDASAWATGTLLLRDTLNDKSHVIKYISPQNIPDKTYAAQGGRMTWTLMAGDIQSTIV